MKIAKLLQIFFFLSIIISSCSENDEEFVDTSLISFEEATFSEDEFIIYLTEDPNGKTFHSVLVHTILRIQFHWQILKI